ncbi:helix-turn-helix transcriptional regulator [Maritalea sp. S77]|uniref:helix-turn-helix transcriptional regulator n=1 Tax=Maritalea sp. S77 TaxID=3415125 RepID=UPI003C7A3A12
MRRADRLIKLVHFLRSRRRAVTAQQIAEEFEVCTRTVYRDIQDLAANGTPIVGEAGIGYLIDKSYYMPPIAFDVEELEALGLGLSMAAQWTDAHLAQNAECALEKIRAVLPKDLQGELEQITTYSMPNQADVPWVISFSDLREAIRKRCKIIIDYTNEAQQSSKRTLRPLALIYCGPVWLLAAWCEKRDNFRNFRLDRISNMQDAGEQFEDDPTKNLTAYKAQDGVC